MPDIQGQQTNFERTKELTDKLEAGLKDLFQSDKYKEYLTSMSHFHHYSSRNIMLIHMQMPGATRVAAYNTWKDKFNRHVKKGEHGIRIFAPIAEKKPETKLMEKLDPITGAPVLDETGKPVMEEMTALSTGPRFKLVPVFDVSQTYGEPLLDLVEDLTGSVAHYEAFMDALKDVSPLPIAFEPMADDQDGYCRYGVSIGIREGMSEIQTVSAVVHEIAHAKLHDMTLPDADQTPKTKKVKEVEAESVSYVINQHFGIETSPNSFGYLAEYGSREMPELKASLDTIRKEANSLINAIDARFQAICKERGIDLSAKEPEKPAYQEEQPPASQKTAETSAEGISKADSVKQDDNPPMAGQKAVRQVPVSDHYEVYQLRDDDALHYHHFASLEQLKAEGLAVDQDNYDLVYTAPLDPTETLDSLFERFNIDHPNDYTGQSLSVSDVVVIQRDGEVTAHYVDNSGFSQIPAFLMDNQREATMPATGNAVPSTESAVKPKEPPFGENVKAVEAKVNAGEMINLSDLVGAIKADRQQQSTGDPPPASLPIREQEKPAPSKVYMATAEEARTKGETQAWRDSWSLNRACAASIQEAITESHRGNNSYDLASALKAVTAEHGAERVQVVLANTVAYKDYDGRFSRDNKEWAKSVQLPQMPKEHLAGFVCEAHPAILDGFINRTREQLREKKPSVIKPLKAKAKQPHVKNNTADKTRKDEVSL